MTDLNSFINQAWDDHVADAPGVALRLPHALDMAMDEAGLMSLAQLAVHVYGEHLAAWRDGLKYLAALGRQHAFDAQGLSGPALLRYRASLALAAGEGDARPTLGASDRVCVTAMAAATLAPHDTARATALFSEALVDARDAGLPDNDPFHRALAVTANNLASTLEVKTGRTVAECDLMIMAARTAREQWALAGGWLEVARTEYRLAMSWLQAGDTAQARVHAQAEVEIVKGQADAPALERFLAWEAMGVVARAAGDATGHAEALARAREAFVGLEAGDQGWCRERLDKLAKGA